jgi:hypothetical protein
VAAGQKAGENSVHDGLLADNDFPDLVTDFLELAGGQLERGFRLHAFILPEN